MKALDVARAALMEVGVDPQMVWQKGDVLFFGPRSTSADLAYRACVLAEMAERGPDSLTECRSCAERVDDPCTPIRDALRGVRCGK